MSGSIIKICKVHGEAKHRSVKRKGRKDSIVCSLCRSEAVKRRRQKVKVMALEYKGSRCECCGYDKCTAALEFHHIDDLTKEFGISEKGETRSWKRIQEELDKCVLLCANCHREVHANLLEV